MFIRPSLRRVPVFTLLVIAVVTQPAAAKSLEEAVHSATQDIVRYLKAKGHASISVGEFTGPPQFSASSGPGITKRFRDELNRQGIDVAKRNTQVGLKGEFILKKQGEQVFVEISGSLVDRFGETLSQFNQRGEQTADKVAGATSAKAKAETFPDDLPPAISESVTDTGEVADLVGATTRLFPNDVEEDRQKDLTRSIVDPSFHLEGTRISAAAGDPYAIEILCNGKALPVHDEEGHAFVSISRNQEYAIRVINASGHDAAVFLSIDGLSLFEFSELRSPDGRPRYRHYILPPNPKGHVFLGWHKTNERVEKFLVTSYPESAAGQLGRPSDGESIGTITVRFHAAWDPHGPPPADEDVTKGDSATGFGPPARQNAREVRRQVGRMRSSVSVRYLK